LPGALAISRHRSDRSGDTQPRGDHHNSGATQHDVIAQGRQAKGETAVEPFHRVAAKGLPGRLNGRSGEQSLRTAQHHLAEVQRSEDRGEQDSQARPRLTQDVVSRERRGGILGGIRQLRLEPWRRESGLEAAARAAAAELSPIGADDDVTDLPRRETATVQQDAAEQKTSPDPATDPHEHEVAPARSTMPGDPTPIPRGGAVTSAGKLSMREVT
jgi:hypothetical protein